MEQQQKKIKLQTCSGCVFYVDENAQYCLAGRLERLKALGKATFTADQQWQLNQVCNIRREPEWAEPCEDLVSKALNEVSPTFGIIVNDLVDCNYEDLLKTIDSICKVDYRKDNIKVVICSNFKRSANQIMNAVDTARSSVPTESITHVLSNIRDVEKETFQRIVNYQYFVHINAGSVLPSNSLSFVNESLNQHLKQTCIFTAKGMTIMPRSIVRQNYLNFECYEDLANAMKNEGTDKGLHEEIK